MMPMLVRKCECHVYAARLRTEIFATTGGNYHKLPSADFIRNRCGVSAERQRCLPQQFPGCFVERTKLFVEYTRSDEQKPTVSNQRSAIIFCTGIGTTLGC